MTTTSRATVWAQTDQLVRVRVKTVDGGTTPLNMTGYALKFIIRDAADTLVCSKITGGGGVTIANGLEDDGVTATGGTNDMAIVAIADEDIVKPPGQYFGALWRTDSGSANPLWEGPVTIRRAAPQ